LKDIHEIARGIAQTQALGEGALTLAKAAVARSA
jgi:hypothetical protein